MATIEKRGQSFRIIFRFEGNRFARSLHTKDERSANSSLAKLEDNIHRVAIGTLTIPEDADVASFLLSNGNQTTRTPSPRVVATTQTQVSLSQLFDRYLASIPESSIEPTTRKCLEIHVNHFRRNMIGIKDIQDINSSSIQDYVNRRAKQPGAKGKPLSACTIKKELVTFKSIWNWALKEKLLSGAYPGIGVRLPKLKQKLPFRTFQEVVHETSEAKLSREEFDEAWESVFLTTSETKELLDFVKQKAKHSFIYPMFVFAAHTGARRSEIIVTRTRDIDLVRRRIIIHEKKRVRLTYSTRSVPISEPLAGVLKDWLSVHPGGSHLFPISPRMCHSNSQRTSAEPLTFEQATHHFNQTLSSSKWQSLKGWHVFRHSFCSNCASAGIDQRLIDEWVGHQTDEMRRRYRHLIPSQQLSALDAVFNKH